MHALPKSSMVLRRVPSRSKIASFIFACAILWYIEMLLLYRNQKTILNFKVMKNTEFSLESVGTFISSEQSLDNLMDLVKELDLELMSVSLS